jgi:hypothetical protein
MKQKYIEQAFPPQSEIEIEIPNGNLEEEICIQEERDPDPEPEPEPENEPAPKQVKNEDMIDKILTLSGFLEAGEQQIGTDKATDVGPTPSKQIRKEEKVKKSTISSELYRQTCQKCSKGFDSHKGFEYHIKNNVCEKRKSLQAPKGVLECAVCNKIFKSQKGLIYHNQQSVCKRIA